MKNLKYPLILLYHLFLMWSCQTVVEVDLPEHEQKLVINSVFNPDSLFTVDVSASRSVFSSEQSYLHVENATVTLYEGGNFLFNLQHVGNGIYKADQKPEALKFYEIQVSAPGFSSVSASNYVPAEPQVFALNACEGLFNEDWQEQSMNVSFTLDDGPEENFYYMQIFTPDTSYESIAYNRNIELISSAPINYEFSMETRLFFSDKLFNGKPLHLTLNLNNSSKAVIYVQVAQITNEYYHYVRTLEKQSYNDNININPLAVTNNIRNGMGLFAGYNFTTLTIDPESLNNCN